MTKQQVRHYYHNMPLYHPTNNLVNLESLGPYYIYRDVVMMTMYCPFLWRKVARMLCKLRCKWQNTCRLTSTQEDRDRVKHYVYQAFKDTKLPFSLKYALRGAIRKDFGFDPDPA